MNDHEKAKLDFDEACRKLALDPTPAGSEPSTHVKFPTGPSPKQILQIVQEISQQTNMAQPSDLKLLAGNPDQPTRAGAKWSLVIPSQKSMVMPLRKTIRQILRSHGAEQHQILVKPVAVVYGLMVTWE